MAASLGGARDPGELEGREEFAPRGAAQDGGDLAPRVAQDQDQPRVRRAGRQRGDAAMAAHRFHDQPDRTRIAGQQVRHADPVDPPAVEAGGGQHAQGLHGAVAQVATQHAAIGFGEGRAGPDRLQGGSPPHPTQVRGGHRRQPGGCILGADPGQPVILQHRVGFMAVERVGVAVENLPEPGGAGARRAEDQDRRVRRRGRGRGGPGCNPASPRGRRPARSRRPSRTVGSSARPRTPGTGWVGPSGE